MYIDQQSTYPAWCYKKRMCEGILRKGKNMDYMVLKYVIIL